MNTKYLHYVLTLAEERSFSRAAKKLYISQPSLSQFINGIEEEIGTKLFDRTTLPLTLTYAGERYIKACKDMLEVEQRLARELEDITEGKRGRLTIGISPLMGAYILPAVFPIFKEEYPHMELRLIEGTSKQLEDLAMQGEADLVLINQSERNSELNCIPLLESNVLLAAPLHHKFVQNMGIHRQPRLAIDLTAIKEEPFILLTRNQGLRKAADEIFHQYGITPNIIFETKSIEIAHRLALQGIGFTMVVEKLIEFYPIEHQTAYYLFDKGPFTYSFAICYRQNMYLSKSILRFIELVRRYVSDLT